MLSDKTRAVIDSHTLLGRVSISAKLVCLNILIDPDTLSSGAWSAILDASTVKDVLAVRLHLNGSMYQKVPCIYISRGFSTVTLLRIENVASANSDAVSGIWLMGVEVCSFKDLSTWAARKT